MRRRGAAIAERPATVAVDVVVVDVAAENVGGRTGYRVVSGYWAEIK